MGWSHSVRWTSPLFQICGGSVHRRKFMHLFLKGFDICFIFRSCHQNIDKRMLRRENKISHAVNGIGAGGKHRELIIVSLNIEINSTRCSARSSFPASFSLYWANPGSSSKSSRRRWGIIGDFKEPLLQILLFSRWRRTAHMLHPRPVRWQALWHRRATIYRGLFFVSQTIFI